MDADYIEDSFAITPGVISRMVIDGRNDITLWTEQDEGQLCLFIAMLNREPQRIALEELSTSLLKRTYFLCECGRRVFKLYQPPHKAEFKCRLCHKLRYRLSTFNRYTTHGRMQYQDNRKEKLSYQRIDIRTPIYRGQYTRRFRRFLRMCERAGLTEVVENARVLMAMIQAFKQTQ